MILICFSRREPEYNDPAGSDSCRFFQPQTDAVGKRFRYKICSICRQDKKTKDRSRYYEQQKSR